MLYTQGGSSTLVSLCFFMHWYPYTFLSVDHFQLALIYDIVKLILGGGSSAFGISMFLYALVSLHFLIC